MEFPLHVVRGNPLPLFCVILGYNFPLLRRLYGDNSLQSLLDEWPCATWPRGKSATLVQHASVAQGIEHRSPKAGVDGSNPPGGTREYDGVAGAAPFLVCGSCRRIRTVGTRVTHFPAGGVFESARGHQRNIEPGTVTVPGSFGLRHAVVFAASDKESARLLGEQAGACERICLRRKPR